MDQVRLSRRRLATPRAAAIAGIIFALLTWTTQLLIRLSVPTSPLDSGAWLSSNAGSVSLAISMAPFAGIAFLWFIGLFRDHLDLVEDRFFCNCIFGQWIINRVCSMDQNYQQTSPFKLLLSLTSIAVLIIAAYLLASYLGMILLGLIFAILLTPVYHWLQRKGVPSWLAMIIMVVGLVVGGLGLIGLFVVSLRQLAGSLETYQTLLAERLAPLQIWLDTIGIDLSGLQMEDIFDPEQIIDWALGFFTGLAGLGATALFILAVIFFALIEASSLSARLQASLGATHPITLRTREFNHLAVKYIGLRAFINVIVAIAVVILTLVMGIDFALLWGVLTFFLGFIPYVGIFISTALPTILAFIQYGLGHAIGVIIAVTIINVSTENLIAPKIVGKGLSLSPLTVFLAFFFWSWVLGPAGMFLSMPLTILVIFILQSYEQTRWLADLAGASSLMPVVVEPQQPAKVETLET